MAYGFGGGSDSGRFGGGTTGSTGKGFGGAAESKYSGGTSSSGKGGRVGGGTSKSSGTSKSASKSGGDTGRFGGGTSGTTGKGFQGTAGSRYSGSSESKSKGGGGTVGKGLGTGTGTGTSPSKGYSQAASSMRAGGIGSVGGRPTGMGVTGARTDATTTGSTVPSRTPGYGFGKTGDTGRFSGVTAGTVGQGFGGAVEGRYGRAPATGQPSADRFGRESSVPATAARTTAQPTADRFGRTATTTAAPSPDRFGPTTAAPAPTRTVTATSLTAPSADIDPTRFGPTTAAPTATPTATPAVQTAAPAMPTADRFGPTGTEVDTGQPAAERFAPTVATAASPASSLSPTRPGEVAGPLSQEGATPSLKAAPVTSGVPDLATAPKAPVSFPAGAVKPTTDVADRVAAAWADVLGPDNVRISMTPHGGLRTSKKGSRSGRHGPKVGAAMDYSVQTRQPDGSWKSLDFGKMSDLNLANKVAAVGAAKYGLKGYGVGNGYMGNRAIHHDIVANPKTGAFEWSGPSARSGTVQGSTKASLAAARASYESNKNKSRAAEKATPTPVAAMQATARDVDAAQTALNQMSGVGQTATAATTSARPAATTAATTAASTARGLGTVQSSVDSTTTSSVSTDPRATQATTAKQATDYKRSKVGEAVALGIDVLTGSNPVGLAANALTAAFLGTTVGGAVWDASHGRWGDNAYQQGAQQRPGGGNYEGAQADRRAALMRDTTAKTKDAAEEASTSTAAPSSNSFEDKYLNDTGRPTPEQKWDWNSSRYLGVA